MVLYVQMYVRTTLCLLLVQSMVSWQCGSSDSTVLLTSCLSIISYHISYHIYWNRTIPPTLRHILTHIMLYLQKSLIARAWLSLHQVPWLEVALMQCIFLYIWFYIYPCWFGNWAFVMLWNINLLNKLCVSLLQVLSRVVYLGWFIYFYV